MPDAGWTPPSLEGEQIVVQPHCHYEVSVAVAENMLLPALRDKSDDAIFLADGFSCRTQATQLADTDGIHLAQLLRRAPARAHTSKGPE